MKGIIFKCTKKSESECFKRLLFESNKIYAPIAMRTKKGDLLFLFNLDTNLLYGVFKAACDAQVKLEPEAMGR
jgi:hypothetical protein